MIIRCNNKKTAVYIGQYALILTGFTLNQRMSAIK